MYRGVVRTVCGQWGAMSTVDSLQLLEFELCVVCVYISLFVSVWAVCASSCVSGR